MFGIVIALDQVVKSVITQRIQVVSTRSGRANIEVDGVGYHSPYDPVREAEKFYSGLPLGEADVVIQFGWGLGYAGAALIERLKPDARVFVLEPDKDVFEIYRSDPEGIGLTDDRRLQFVVGDQIHQFLDDACMDCQETDRFLWIDWPRAVQMTGDLSQSLHAAFDAGLRDRAGNLLTHFQNGSLYFENAIANMQYATDPVVGRLSGQFANVPLVLVSAGPSLDRNIRYLQGMESRCFILSVDTALRPLLAAGVTPHAVIIADPSELNARHIVGAVPASTFLIAEQAVHPLAMAQATKRFQFSVGVFPDGLYNEFGLERSPLKVWGSVATAGLDLACLMGADPIIFLGQDLSYTCGRSYASHTIFDGCRFDPKSTDRTGDDVWGRKVPTTENLIAYRDYFIRRVRQSPRVRIINATEGGILAGEGIELLSLRDALYQSAFRSVDVESKLNRLHKPGTSLPDMRGHLADVLQSGSRDCQCLEDFLELVAKEALLKNDDTAVQEAIEIGLAATRESVHR